MSTKDQIEYQFVDPRGVTEMGRGCGVTRDVYSSFWVEISDSYLIGEQERVPYVRHDLYKEEWEAIGMIFVKGFLDTGYFPSNLSKAFINYCLFGETSSEVLIESFKNYVSADERQLLLTALEGNEEAIYSSDDMLDFLDVFKCRSALTKNNAKEIVMEIARQELIQKPYIMAACWSKSFDELKSHPEFSSEKSLGDLLERVQPNAKRVINLLEVNPSDDAERDIIGYLKRYIKGLDSANIKKFLRFLTGSDIIVVDVIKIQFIKNVTPFARRPIAHTCGPVLELPVLYNNFCELREDFSNILSLNTWEMNIV